jgi:hypothetical protein
MGRQCCCYSNLQYLQSGRKDGEDNALKLMEQCAIDGIGQVLKKFRRDIKEKFFERHESTAAAH